jgi:CheY-like chemotaxis protein
MYGQPVIILLVEDNPDHTELIARSFQGQRITNQLYYVPDGEAALDYLFRRGDYADPEKSPRPHLILLDLRLPRVDGLEVLRAIKTSDELRPIPTVVLTTSGAERDIARAYEHRANSYLLKPVDLDRFVQLMDDLGLYWLDWNRQPWS